MTPDRRDRIIALLGLIVEGLPEPSRRSHATAGFVHDQPVRETCADCLANDRRMFGCETCGGRGYTETRRTRDPYAIDKTQPYGITPDRREAELKRDLEIEQLGQRIRDAEKLKTAADEIAAANEHGYPWEQERRRNYERFHVAELERALDTVRDVDPRAHTMLYAVHVYGWFDVTSGEQSAATRGLRILDALLPTPLKAPKRAEPTAEAEPAPSPASDRNARMRLLAEHGWKPAEIAADIGVSIRTVYNVVNRTPV